MSFLERTVLLLTAFVLASPSAAQQRGNTWWTDYGGGPGNAHFYGGSAITKDNVDDLEIAWSYSTKDNGGYQFSPIIVDGVMYVLARDYALVALDISTGEELWIHENLPNITRRGVNYWESPDGTDKRLLFTLNHTLQAIDADTGLPITSFGVDGYVDLRAGLRREHQEIYRIAARTPGEIYDDLLILGSTTGEGYTSPPGDIRAYNVVTGDLAWQFHTIPHPGEAGYETWPPGAWQYAGAANVWGEMAIDVERGILFAPTGSSTYDFYGADRHGANLFANSLLALDARTGERIWHFQTVHHDLWDFDMPASPQLITLQRNGETIDAVAQATKHGYLYVFDRETGEPVFPIEEVQVPRSDVPGEASWRTQPIPDLPPFGRLTFTVEDINPYLPVEERERIEALVRDAANEGYFTPPALDRGSVQMPGNRGGSNWGTTSANPPEGIVYVMNSDAPALLELSRLSPGEGEGETNGAELFEIYCQACHGENAAGAVGPALAGAIDRLGQEGVENMIVNGGGQMPGFSFTDEQFDALMDFIQGLDAGGDAEPVDVQQASEQPAPARGPVVASGGAEAAKAFVETMPQGRPPGWTYHMGAPYPRALETPEERFYSDYNVHQRWIKPPWSSMVAYDLNAGTIKWNIPIGEDPDLVERGIRNTGIPTDQRAPLVTATGVLLVGTSDGYFRAVDADDGTEIWSMKMPGTPGIFPSIYELDGRPYVVVPAARGGEDPSYVVLTLPLD